MATRPLPTAIAWFLVAFDLAIAALALGLYSGALPKFHPLLAQLPPGAYLVATVVFAAGAALVLLTQSRLRRR